MTKPAPYTVLYHHPVGRFEIVRRKAAPTHLMCAWCGGCRPCKTTRLWNYSARNDDSTRAPSFSNTPFCSIQCWRNYNVE